MTLKINSRKHLVSGIAILLACSFAYGCSNTESEKQSTTTVSRPSSTTTTTTAPPQEPDLETEVIIDNLTNPWEIAFIDEDVMLFTERSGELNKYEDNQVTLLAEMQDIEAGGEGGLLGLAIDKDFENNSFVYTCFNHNDGERDVRVVRFKLNEEKTQVVETSPIVTGIPAASSGRHSGCRIKAATDGTLFISTGDAAQAQSPQDPNGLGGKVLHVDRNGNPILGNLLGDFDPRILSYGHRNVQGIALFDTPRGNIYGVSAEHGPDRDDEINLLVKGNFGWSPTGSYNEDVPMTDLDRFPDAKTAIWSSGSPTKAVAGATFLYGENWGSYNGALVVAALKAQEVNLYIFNDDYSIAFEKTIITDFGRIRVATLGPDSNLYISTDDKSDGKIIKVTPTIKK